jgi:plastocyanin
MMVWAGFVWTVWLLSALVLVVGLGMGLWVLVRRRDDEGRGILAERFARGELSVEEYRERKAVLDSESAGSRARLVIAAVALIVLGVAGLGLTSVSAARHSDRWMRDMMNGDMGSMMSMMQSGPTERSVSRPDPAAGTITVVAREFSFAPSMIRLRPGETINIALENQGHMFHTFTVPELDFDLRAQSGDTIAGALTAEREGTYEFICAVPEHAEMGMRGRIIVTAR